MLWLALHFPLLAREALPLRQSPSAVVSRGRVLVCDRLAAAAGVAVGQKLATALGLQPALAVFERAAAREAAALEALACWAGRFSPTVSLSPPNGLLLEIGGCLRLFGGAPALVEAVLAGCAAQSYSTTWAVAPTPLGATWLARGERARIYPDQPAMQAALADLPLAVATWPAEIEARLIAFGLCRLGEVRALPGGELRQRIGNGPLDELARAWGTWPDPRPSFVFPEKFQQKIELPARVEQAEALVFAGQRLCAALAGWLGSRQLRARACVLQLTHDTTASSALVLRFAEAVAEEVRFVRLLREHLSRLQLPAAVLALTLTADEVEAVSGASAGLFEQAAAGEGTQACLERLRARLGPDAVLGLAEQPDYRPECATRFLAAGTDAAPAGRSTAPGKASRPLWLLPAPQALPERDGSPHWHGPLQLLSRAERLESGWWDEGEGQGGTEDEAPARPAAVGDVRRDYFVARNPRGQWAWVFRDADGWFLHGLFA